MQFSIGEPLLAILDCQPITVKPTGFRQKGSDVHTTPRLSGIEDFQKDHESLPGQHLLCLLGIFLAGSSLPLKDQCAREMARVPPQGFPEAPDELMADALHLVWPH